MEKKKIGIIGLGIGSFYITAISNIKSAVVTAICDTDVALLEKVAKENSITKTYTDYRDLLREGDVDAVCICTPDHFHCQMVKDALAAGKHILCEKPLALHTNECAEMLEASKRSDRILMVGQVCRFTPSFMLAKKLVDSGMIGELYFVESEYAHDYSQMVNNWRRDPANMRHPVTGGGCHAVDLLRWIAGNPIEVYALTNKKCLTDWPCDDSAISVLKFPNNVMGKVYVSTGCKRDYTMRTVLYGTKGTIITDNTSPTLSLFVDSLEGITEIAGLKMKKIEHKIPVSINNHNFRSEVNDFCAVLNGEHPLEVTAWEGAATVAVCEAIIASAESGNPETVAYLPK